MNKGKGFWYVLLDFTRLPFLMQGYQTKNMFLTTQMPLEYTKCDLWRMVYDYNCSTIIMLNTLSEVRLALALFLRVLYTL